MYWIEDDPFESRARPSENVILSADWYEGELAEWSVSVAYPNHPADDYSFVTVASGTADTAPLAKLAAVEAWRRWAREQATAAGWEVQGD